MMSTLPSLDAASPDRIESERADGKGSDCVVMDAAIAAGGPFLEVMHMMTNRRILNYVNAEPFQSFRIEMASGEAFDIRHPEMIQVGRTTASVFMWMNEDEEELREREQEISILLIESIEPLTPANM